MQITETEQKLHQFLSTAKYLQNDDRHTFVEDESIAEKLNWSVDDVYDYVDLCEERGFIEVTRLLGGRCIFMLTSLGRTQLRDPAYVNLHNIGTNINFNAPISGSIFNFQSILSNVNQHITTSNLDQNYKSELTHLFDQLSEELSKVDAEHVDDAEVVAETAKVLVDNATKVTPNKKLIAISAEGLKKAATNIGSLMPTVLPIAIKIIEILNK